MTFQITIFKNINCDPSDFEELTLEPQIFDTSNFDVNPESLTLPKGMKLLLKLLLM